MIQDHWKLHIQASLTTTLRQGYLNSQPERVVRIRIESTALGEHAMLTIKGNAKGIRRDEWEYPIPVDEAQQLLSICEQPLIEKSRYRIKEKELTWEIDEFHGDNAGLVIAEVELASEDQIIIRPNWLGEEVSLDHRYANASLFKCPFSQWS